MLRKPDYHTIPNALHVHDLDTDRYLGFVVKFGSRFHAYTNTIVRKTKAHRTRKAAVLWLRSQADQTTLSV